MIATIAWHHYFVSAILSVVLMACHFLARYLKRISWLDPVRITSFAGGVAVGYVFLHMLPELVESRDQIHKLLDKVTLMSQFKDLVVFTVALIGFELFYVVERYASDSDVSSAILHKRNFVLHLILYFFYNFIITYTMLLRLDTGIFYAILFTIAMGLHFVLTDNHFNRYFPHYFGLRSRLFLLVGLALGYVISIIVYPVNVYVTALLIAFLAGAVLYNAFAEEIPMNRQTSVLFFFIGTAVMAFLLAFQLLD